MSLGSLNNKNKNKVFSKNHDEEIKKNFQNTLDELPENKEKNSIGKKIELNITAKSKVHKQSVTFSITPDQLEKLNKIARERGFKGRSDLLSAIIDAL
ncbi:hypothetical protein F5ESL0236_07650 [Lactobacillus sp. ESL0236]|uniref:ribbon-helix-helix domain-containing protein n=1 Tax=unclassified Lactobacillus TaxID=2620435 RepID=UPI000EFA8D82|nr:MULTISPECIES: ribbon-helix-helix domain-containing protein [unclassified Lactobacillus]RMC38098.1 hypothetical protein F5ESL0237_07625 [Lactobacillus sp. ESL0237]RMC42649.1 hypothetical protein F5ESL0234_07620 [Lactobacillus sp. ESL0234]RMC43326.1 hypothetical protein F5ESL0236_07650 [Lactobacillus sp. ESL0236]